MLPENLQDEYSDIILMEHKNDKELIKYVKAADKLSALVKCIEEIRVGNDEFKSAKISTERLLHDMNMTEVEEFIESFLPSFSLIKISKL